MKKKMSLPMQILLALVLGVIVGLICYFTGTADFTANYLKPFGTIFVNLLKFIVVPVVLFSMIDGILSMDDMKKVGAVGWKTVAFFLCTTAVACVIGLVMANIFNGAGLFPTLALEEGAVWEKATSANFMDTLVGIFPSNMWDAFVKANMLQVIVIALFFGGAIMAAGEKGKLCRDIVSSFNEVINRLMAFIISLSPIGVFTMMAWVVATQGTQILGSLALVLLCAYIAYILHAILVYSFSAKVFADVSPLKFFKGAFAAMMFAFTSTSSAATLPVSKECAHELGAEDDIAAFVLPLGSTINMDGTAIYQCVATVFLATCAGMHLTIGQMITIVVTATLASIGTAGVSGAGMIMLAMVLTAMGIDVNLIMIIYGVDRLFDMGRTCLNVTGDIACSLCVTKWRARKPASNPPAYFKAAAKRQPPFLCGASRSGIIPIPPAPYPAPGSQTLPGGCWRYG
ncbi:dicarboxylate/amino acid:cation symporter [Dysosmobacter sp.]|uniref:dicarboxylate/amino acid:cation symporter n=1 Tax=Dysosmobacter sp. TaxID=2591382 RepID=UPI002A86E432|nr:dicarboxylate/amino acid:cation symporter [Dysosmobacter sp.]MDY3985547.1 dicarboxylate/amino acid:cation symporter [Dysosmobacter sp.]